MSSSSPILEAVDFDPFAGPAVETPVPSTEPQREIWAATRMGDDASCAFNEANALRLEGRLDAGALRESFRALVARHEALSATFGADGRTLEISPERRLEVALLDLTTHAPEEREAELGALCTGEVERPFDLERGPLVRATLVRLAAEDHLLVFTAHHIVCDGWSTAVLLRELAELYSARRERRPERLAPPFAFAAYAREQAARQLTPEHAEDERFWVAQLGGTIPPLDLPTDRPRLASRSYAAARVDHPLGRELVQRLKKAGAGAGASFVSVLLAGFGVLLHRLTGGEDIVVGLASAGQVTSGHPDLVGHCVNTLPIRCRLGPGEPFGEVLRRTRGAILDASEHAELTYGEILRGLALPRDPSRLPLVSVFFNLDQGLGAAALSFAGLRSSFRALPRRFENFELFVNAVEQDGELTVQCQYNRDLFDEATVRRWLAAWEVLLSAIGDGFDAPIGDLPVLPAEERMRLEGWSGARRAIAGTCACDLVAEHRGRTPDAVALEHGAERVTYRDLDERSNRLARRLRGLGVGAEVLVGLCLERSVEMVVALIAIHKAGGAYLPIDPAFPADRIAFLLEDARPPVVVTQASLAEALPGHGAVVVRVDGDAAAIAAESAAPLTDAGTADRLAYVLYTSGSTGKPKGVEVGQRALTNLLESMRREPGLGPEDVLVAVTTLSFDIAQLELWLPLLVGARLVLAPRDAVGDGVLLRRLLEERGATAMQATPSTWRLLLGAGWTGAPTFEVIVGGEALSRELADDLVALSGNVWNAYGPTETTIWSSCHRVERDGRPVPIGHAIANTVLHVLDRRGHQILPGVPGELYIGGAGVARGYRGRQDLTAERFLPDPFVGVPGARMYRTGDVVRHRPDGALEFLGRNDHQVKVRGFRIELGEVETALSRHPGVRQAVATAREDRPGDVRLVAYVTAAAEAAPDEAELRELLRRSLPEYMVPQRVLALAAFPLTPNGKVDRKALPAPDADTAVSEHRPPRTELERLLAGLWQDALGVGRIGLDDDFFQLGGHSLLAAQVSARLSREHGITLPFRKLFDAPTIARLAPLLGKDEELPPIRRRELEGPTPLSVQQRRVWFLTQLDPKTRIFNVPSAFRLRGRLDVGRLEHALGEFCRRHPATRAVFRLEGSEPVQVQGPELEFHLEPAVDLRGHPDAEAELAVLLREAAAVPFDLERGPLFRVTLYRLGDEEHAVLAMPHHAVWDGWSFDLFHEELDAIYRALSRGAPPALPPLPIRYTDFAAWQAEWLKTPQAEAQLAYWSAQLAGDPQPLALPTDRPASSKRSDAGATEWVEIPRTEVDALTALGRRAGATLNMVMLAAYETLLHRYTGQRDVIVGTPVRGRAQPETENVVGYFVNTILLRTRVDPEASFLEVLERVRRTLLDGFQHQDVPFELIAMGRNPILRTVFSFQDARARPRSVGDLAREQLHVLPRVATNDLTLWFLEKEVGLAGGFNYSTDLFDQATARRMLESFRAILRAVVADARRPVGTIPLSDDARAPAPTLVTATTVSVPLHEAFGALARKQPGAAELIVKGAAVTRGELDARARRLARRLSKAGAGPGTRVAVATGRSAETPVALLAISRLGAAAVPVDPDEPVARAAALLTDARPVAVVALPGWDVALPAGCSAVEPIAAGGQEDGPGAAVTSEAVALVAYTRDAAGQPLGVELDQRALAAAVEGVIQAIGIGEADVVAAAGPVGSGRSWLEVALALRSGARLLVLEPDEVEDPERLREALERGAATVLQAGAETWRAVADAGFRGGEEFKSLCGGEPIPRDVAERVADLSGHAYATYGAAESAFWAGVGPLDRARPERLRGALPGTRWYVVDLALRPVPVGVPGELVVAGDAVARGFAGRSDVGASRLAADPLGSGGRAVRTGDRVRLLADGTLEHLGRMDAALTVGGRRIAPVEVEAALASHPAVAEAAIALHAVPTGERVLVAHWVARPGAETTDTELRRHLRRSLPPHLVPQRFAEVDALPRTAAGALDRAALRMPFRTVGARTAVPPRTEAERLVAEVWKEALHVEEVGVHDNFFELGGHSLLCLQVIERLEQRTGKRLSPAVLLLETLERVAPHLGAAHGKEAPRA